VVVEFEWDAEKELANIQKHKVAFTEAVETFFDGKGFQLVDKKHSTLDSTGSANLTKGEY
jgi:uncharacterized DUF497 family protein